MSDQDNARNTAPGEGGGQAEAEEKGRGVLPYVVGLALAAVLTAASFAVAFGDLVWAPAVPPAIVALAVAQMGVHLVFFLHITSGRDNLNNTIAVAFGTFVCILLVFGSVWIMTHLDHRAMTGEMPAHVR